MKCTKSMVEHTTNYMDQHEGPEYPCWRKIHEKPNLTKICHITEFPCGGISIILDKAEILPGCRHLSLENYTVRNWSKSDSDHVQSNVHTRMSEISASRASNNKHKVVAQRVATDPRKDCVALMWCDRSAISMRLICPRRQVGATPKPKNCPT